MPARYPEIVEYNEAVQNPAHAFRDPELRQGRIEVNNLGLPLALSGGFALTYMMRSGGRKLAVRCFLREIPAVQQKYAAIAGAMRALKSRYFVDFEYLADGITLHGQTCPVVKMDWAEGDTLGVWLGRHHQDRRAMARLREQFVELAAWLEQHGIAHGDIQNGNVIVSPDGLKLVDYDGVYVPGMPPEFACECGHRHFQHPLRTTAHFGPQIDRFSFIVTDLSLAALIEDSSLYERFRRGGEAIIFHAGDFADPNGSELLRVLLGHPDLAASARHLAAICRGEIGDVPSLADYRAGRNIPARIATPTAARPAVGAQPNRALVARLLGNDAPPPAVSRSSASPPPARPPQRSNRAVVQSLHEMTPAPAPLRTSSPVAAQQMRQPAGTVRPPMAPRPGRRIPKTGSFVIHPRMRAPPPPAEPPRHPVQPEGLWGRMLRRLGIS